MGDRTKSPRGDARFWLAKAFAPVAVLMFCAGLAGCARDAAKQEVEPPMEAEAGVVSEIVGVATVSDGDTIRIGPRRIRLDGIATPEQGSRCGEVDVYRAAADALREITRSHEVRCRISDQPDADGRDIAQCRVGETDLNEHMVSRGWARDWPRYSGGAYADEEVIARAGQLGVWSQSCPAGLWSDSDYN